MPGPAPKEPQERRRRNEPAKGEWRYAEGIGWQHGRVPKCPDGLTAASKTAWKTWLNAWFASFWTPDDLPGLRQVIRLYDQIERGEFQRAGELRMQMNEYGISPKGQQDRRWKPPREDAPELPQSSRKGSHYGHLKAVGDEG